MNNRETKLIELLVENAKNTLPEDMLVFHLKELYKEDVEYFTKFDVPTQALGYAEYESGIVIEVRSNGEFVEEWYSESKGITIGGKFPSLEDRTKIETLIQRMSNSIEE